MSSDLPKTSWKRDTPFRLGDLEVLPASCELRGRKGVARLRPLLMDILLRLAAERGEVVRRETLLEDVWPRRMVNDEVLSRAIAELRTALGDDARGARYIETLPKLGYRLVATVEEIESGVAPAMAPAAQDTTPVPPAPAPVLPPPPALPRRWPYAAGVVAVVALGALAWSLSKPKPQVPENLAAMITAARPLTSDPGLELSPRFSHDGKRVAFALAEGNESRIVVQAVDGSDRQFVGGLTGAARLSPVFLPGDRKVAYWKNQAQECAVIEHDLDTSLERKLLDCSLVPRPRFDISRDGRWLVFSGSSRPQFPAGLWVMEIDRGTPVNLTAPEPGMGDDIAPRFSPDGRRIAFYRGSESHRSPWVVDVGDSSSARVAATVEGLSYGMSWLGRDGPLLAAADWFGFRALNTIDLDTGEAKLLGARGARYPDVGPNGEVVYENAMYSANIWRLDTAPRAPAPRMIWQSTRYTSQPEFSRDNRRVVFSSNRDGADAIYVAALDGDPRRIAFGKEHRYLRPHWSADGLSVYAVRSANHGKRWQEALRIPAEGGPAVVLNTLGNDVIDVREGGDGNLYWAELSGHAMRLLRAPLASPEKSERLPVPLVVQYQISAGRMVFAQPQLPALTVCRLDTMACEPLGLDLASDDVYHWTLGARAVYLRTIADGTPRLSRYDLDTRKFTRSWALSPSGSGASLAVTSDEKTLLVAREEGPTIDLMIARP
ncbi:MAG: winged helix-turn-helix domain-containing protein [Usitatibacter sp.]